VKFELLLLLLLLIIIIKRKLKAQINRKNVDNDDLMYDVSLVSLLACVLSLLLWML